MDRLSFLPADLHATFWDIMFQAGLADCITGTTKDKEQLTVDMLNCALFEIFYSMEPIAGFNYEELFGKRTDKKTLFETLHARNIVDWAEHDLPKPTPSNPEAFVTVKTYPELLEMTTIGFEPVFYAFKDRIEMIIKTALRGRFNPYSIVDLQSTVDRLGRVTVIVLTLTGDIRHKFFLEQFPDGRYRTNHNPGSNMQ